MFIGVRATGMQTEEDSARPSTEGKTHTHAHKTGGKVDVVTAEPAGLDATDDGE